MEAKIRWCWGILPIMWISFVYFYLELTSQPASNPFRVNNEKFNSKRGTDYFDNLQSIKLKTGWICFCWILHSFVFDFSIYYFYEKSGQKSVFGIMPFYVFTFFLKIFRYVCLFISQIKLCDNGIVNSGKTLKIHRLAEGL